MDDVGAGTAGQSGGRHLHPAFLPVFRDGRAARRQVRQGHAGTAGQGAGDGHHGGRGGRLHAAQPGGADGGAVPARPALNVVRAGQVRHSAAASAYR